MCKNNIEETLYVYKILKKNMYLFIQIICAFKKRHKHFFYGPTTKMYTYVFFYPFPTISGSIKKSGGKMDIKNKGSRNFFLLLLMAGPFRPYHLPPSSLLVP